MNIVFLSGHACIRVQKMALPLLDKGHNIHLIAGKLPGFFEAYRSVSIYADIGQMIEIIDTFEKSGKVDLYHCHNEPSWFVTLLKERTDKPVILDVHDSFLTRSTPEEHEADRAKGLNPTRITAEERTSCQLADALIFVSESVKKIVTNEFKLNQPSLVLPSYVPEFLYKYNFGKWMGGLVYEGKVIRLEELESTRGTGFHYCDYRQLAQDCKNIGMDFHIYGGGHNQELEDLYGDSAFIHKGYGFKELLGCVSRHDWGLVGNTIKSPQWAETLPNKLFEYVAAGVPVVSINARESSELIAKYGIGMTVDSIEELASKWETHRQYRNNVIRMRKELSMENHISELEKFYERILHG